MQKITHALLLVVLAAATQGIIVELNKFNTETCFYIRGAYSDDDFSCQFSVSGEGNKNVKVTVNDSRYFWGDLEKVSLRKCPDA